MKKKREMGCFVNIHYEFSDQLADGIKKHPNNPFDLHFIGSQFYSGTLSYEYPTIDNDLFNIYSKTNNNNTFFETLSKHFSIMRNRKKVISRTELLKLILNQSRKPRQDIFGFIELHIEQGPVLEANDKPVGVVTSINGMTVLHLGFSGCILYRRKATSATIVFLSTF